MTERETWFEERSSVSELLGEYRHKLDAKGRLSLPADFRKALSTNLKVTPDPKISAFMCSKPKLLMLG